MAAAVAEQRQVLFPRMREIEEAKLREDRNLRGGSVPSKEWSPTQLPYKVYEKSGEAMDDSDESDDSDAEDSEREEKAEMAAATSATSSAAEVAAEQQQLRVESASAPSVIEVDGLSIGMEEPDLADLEAGAEMAPEEGFIYKGPEPTLYGDWQHKGRATDF